jgi:putative SOS response-associated peptidase YedK
LTKEASPLFAKIHNKKERQPIILDEVLTNNWLSHDLNDSDIIEIVNSSYLDDNLQTYPVSKDLFSPKVDSNVETIVEKVEYSELTNLYLL